MKLFKRYDGFYLVFFIHLLFGIIRYVYSVLNVDDEEFYWFDHVKSIPWLNYQPLPIGNTFMLYLDYIPAYVLHLPQWVGFIFYFLISTLGIYIFWKFCQRIFPTQYQPLTYLPVFLVPSLHFWVNGISKETLLFTFLSLMFYDFYFKNFKSARFILSVLFICLIRPHVGLILFLSFFIYYLFFRFKLNTKSFSILLASIAFGLFCYYLTQYAAILPSASLDSIITHINLHHTHLRETTAYVPLETYSYPYKLFTFFFRPLVGELNNRIGWVTGLENLLFLLSFIAAAIIMLKNYKKLKLPTTFYFIIIFSIVYASVFTLAYSNFGLLARTKILVTPYLWMIFAYIMSQYIIHKKSQN